MTTFAPHLHLVPNDRVILHHYLYIEFWEVGQDGAVVALRFVIVDMGRTCDKCNFGTTFASHWRLTAFGPGHLAHIGSSVDVRNLLISL
jgi:hypothetical protein